MARETIHARSKQSISGMGSLTNMSICSEIVASVVLWIDHCIKNLPPPGELNNSLLVAASSLAIDGMYAKEKGLKTETRPA